MEGVLCGKSNLYWGYAKWIWAFRVIFTILHQEINYYTNMNLIFDFTSIYALLVICGVVKLYIYYKSFGISIIEYLDLSEILILFFDNILSYLVVLIIGLFSGFNFIHNLESLGYFFDFLLQNNFWWRLLIYVKVNSSIIWIMTVFIAGTCLYQYLNSGVHKYEMWLLATTGIITLFLMPVLYYEIRIFACNHYLKEMPPQLILMVIMAIFLVLLSMANALNEQYKVKKLLYYKGSSFTINDKIVESTSEFYYIGKTQKYVFFYEPMKRLCHVEPIQNIKKYSFQKKEKLKKVLKKK